MNEGSLHSRPADAEPASTAPVSVVVPAHDAADTLADALVSALHQRPAPREVIVVDDGSSDATADVARSTAASLGVPVIEDAGRAADQPPPAGPDVASGPVVRIIRQPKSGPSGARNTGIGACTEPWIAFLDADDVWHAGKLARQLALADDGVAAVASDWVRRGDPAGATPAAAGAITTITERDLLVLNRFQTSTVLARTDAVRDLGGFDPTIDGVEDWDMWRRLAGRGRIVKIDAPLVSYVNRSDSYSKDLVRVYETAMTMVKRAVTGLPRRDGRRLRAWHHLRFAVAFALARDWDDALRCCRDIYRAGLLSAVPEATARHLAPFLYGRLRRRLPGNRAPGATAGKPT